MSAAKEPEKDDTLYDTIVVGAGIAGLHVALELRKRGEKVLVLEKYGSVGGRASTYKHVVEGKKVQWEAGAGRISSRHERLRGLMRRYGLTWLPIGGSVQYKAAWNTPLEPNAFEPAFPVFLDTLAGLPEEDLRGHTIRQLLERIHGPQKADGYLVRNPYRAEVDTMRADMALELFRGELGGKESYGVCAEGLSAVIEGLRANLEKKNVKILERHELVGIQRGGAAAGLTLSVRVGPVREGTGRPDTTFRAGRVVLAIPSVDAERLEPVKSWEGFRRLKMVPLLRIYGVFPKGDDGKLWYEKYGGRIVTAGPVRYMIPGNPKTGTAMISYTDSQDAEYWMERIDEHGEYPVGQEVLAELRRLLEPSIPPMEFVKAHAWRHGCTYWLPGDYTPKEMSRRAASGPVEGWPIYLVGESYSTRQGWIEGALEHADIFLEGRGSRSRNSRSRGYNRSVK
jgi:glycine/D-amino acid oxidase-like deaminating enzyme